MFVELYVTVCLSTGCITKEVSNSEFDPRLTPWSCMVMGQAEIAEYITQNFPRGKLKAWGCRVYRHKPPPKPDV